MSPLLDVPVHLAVALSVASHGVKGPDEREALAALFERSAARVTTVSRVLDAPSGPYFFSTSGWLAYARQFAPPAIAGRIFKTSSGQHYMPPGIERDRLLALRSDPELSQAMARFAATRNNAALAAALGRPASTGDLLLAHLMGTAATLRVIEAAALRPDVAFAGVAGADANALKAVAAGVASLSVGAVYRQFVGSVDRNVQRVVGAKALKGPVAQASSAPIWPSTAARQPPPRIATPVQ